LIWAGTVVAIGGISHLFPQVKIPAVIMFFLISIRFFHSLAFMPVKNLQILKVVAAGLILLIATITAIVISASLPPIISNIFRISEDLMVPIVEETVKAFFATIAVLSIYSKSQNVKWFLSTGGLTLGFIFGLLETLTSESYKANFLLRSVTSVPDHAITTGLVTGSIGYSLELYKKLHRIEVFCWTISAWIFATIWHAIWNTTIYFNVIKWIPTPAFLMFGVILWYKRPS
jgi:hypothetical protein